MLVIPRNHLEWSDVCWFRKSCDHSKNDLLTHGSVILKERTGTEHALFSFDTLLAR